MDQQQRDRQRFGQVVRSMRRQRIALDAGDYRQWTQADLARRADLTLKQIKRIEQGEVVNLRPWMRQLADAFDLTEHQRVEFYALAGFVYPVTTPVLDRQQLENLLVRLPYPAYVRTPLWDFVAFNKHSARLWGYDEPEMMTLFRDDLGPNFLRTVFDPRFHHRRYLGSDSAWEADARRCVHGFRGAVFLYGDTQRYRQIVNGLNRYSDFRRLWDLDEPVPLPSERAVIVEVSHPEYGPMTFASTRVPSRYVGDHEIGVYVPLGDTSAYQRLCDEIPNNRVFWFSGREVGNE